MTAGPKHGDERNRHIARDAPTTVDMIDTGGGQLDFSMSYSSREFTCVERYCGTCKAWVTCGPGGLIEHMLCRTCKTDWRAS